MRKSVKEIGNNNIDSHRSAARSAKNENKKAMDKMDDSDDYSIWVWFKCSKFRRLRERID